MRGKALHNRLASEIKDVFNHLSVPVQLEYGIWLNGKTAYFDVAAMMNGDLLVCEIETTIRNVIHNVQKADAFGAELWIVVPTRKLRNQINNKLQGVDIRPADKPINLFLLAQLQQALMEKLSLSISANSNGRIAIENRKKFF